MRQIVQHLRLPHLLCLQLGLVMLAVLLLCSLKGGAESALRHPDATCAKCHQAIYEQYEQTNMARGSGDAVEGVIAGTFRHEASGVTYRVYTSGGKAWLSYDRPGAAAPLHGAQELAYFIGSGHRGRTYLFQQEQLWFEAPINYYGKKQLWDMAPNYGNTHTMPMTLPVDSNCLHCHASEVGTAIDGVRNKYRGGPFAAGGIGCSACHGDPGSHLASEAAHTGVGLIVNPSRLGPAERDSACLQCHLEGDAAVYRAGKSLATDKVGENLGDSVIYFVNTRRPNFGDRASSEYEALLRSACKRAAGDKLTCTSCHDPHSSPAPKQRIAFYRNKCLACHAGEAIAARHHPEQQDCAVCHMPTRDTLDISHEQLTDHDIESVPRSKHAPLQLTDLGQPSARREPVLAVVGDTRAGDRELGLAYAQLARNGDRHSGELAQRLLAGAVRAGIADEEVLLQLGFLEQMAGNTAEAARQYHAALDLEPSDPVVLANLAVLDASSGRADEAIRLLQQSVEVNPSQTRAAANLAFLQCVAGRKGQALKTLEMLRRFNPDDAALREFAEKGIYGGQKCALY